METKVTSKTTTRVDKILKEVCTQITELTGRKLGLVVACAIPDDDEEEKTCFIMSVQGTPVLVYEAVREMKERMAENPKIAMMEKIGQMMDKLKEVPDSDPRRQALDMINLLEELYKFSQEHRKEDPEE